MTSIQALNALNPSKSVSRVQILYMSGLKSQRQRSSKLFWWLQYVMRMVWKPTRFMFFLIYAGHTESYMYCISYYFLILFAHYGLVCNEVLKEVLRDTAGHVCCIFSIILLLHIMDPGTTGPLSLFASIGADGEHVQLMMLLMLMMTVLPVETKGRPLQINKWQAWNSKWHRGFIWLIGFVQMIQHLMDIYSGYIIPIVKT